MDNRFYKGQKEEIGNNKSKFSPRIFSFTSSKSLFYSVVFISLKNSHEMTLRYPKWNPHTPSLHTVAQKVTRKVRTCVCIRVCVCVCVRMCVSSHMHLMTIVLDFKLSLYADFNLSYFVSYYLLTLKHEFNMRMT